MDTQPLRALGLAIILLAGAPAAQAAPFVAGLPEMEFKLTYDVCNYKVRTSFGAVVPTGCLIESFKNRWVSMFNRSIAYLNTDVNMSCEATHEVFDATSAQIRKEVTDLMKIGYMRNSKMDDYAEDLLAKLQAGRGARDSSCGQGHGAGAAGAPSGTGTGAAPNQRPQGQVQLGLSNSNTSAVTVTAQANTNTIAGADVQAFSGGGPLSRAPAAGCEGRDVPACDNTMMKCLQACNSAPNVDACNNACQSAMLSCKGCGQ